MGSKESPKEDGSEGRKGSLGYVINKHQQYMCFNSQAVQVSDACYDACVQLCRNWRCFS